MCGIVSCGIVGKRTAIVLPHFIYTPIQERGLGRQLYSFARQIIIIITKMPPKSCKTFLIFPSLTLLLYTYKHLIVAAWPSISLHWQSQRSGLFSLGKTLPLSLLRQLDLARLEIHNCKRPSKANKQTRIINTTQTIPSQMQAWLRTTDNTQRIQASLKTPART